MKVEQIYTGCLAEAAYYIESNGEAAIIDPLRETAPYTKRAEKDNAKIKYIFETHFHADFVSGHIELAEKTGGTIVYGPRANCQFECHEAKDGEVFNIGNITITALHTPGHTMESTTYLLTDESGKQHCIFTGDTLFIGDVGRPDLAIKSDLTKEDLAGYLYDSLHHKIMALPDDVIVYPAHGAGSACGKSMSKETFDTLGHQKQVNYALQPMGKQEFIEKVTDGLNAAPQYFPKNAMMNKQGAKPLEEVMQQGSKAWEPNEFENVAESTGALLLDVRDPQVFAQGFVPNAINIGLNGQFAPWVGALITDLTQPILLITDAGKEEETVTRLARVGYDNTIGYLKGGIEAWKATGKEVDTVHSISPQQFEQEHGETANVLDVRRVNEYETEHLVDADNKPLDYINDWMGALDRNKPYYIHCAGGYRSMITASILKARGFDNITEVAGGYGAIKNTSLPRTTGINQEK